MAKKKRPKDMFAPGVVRKKPYKPVKPYCSKYSNKRVGADETLYEAWRQHALERDGHQCQWMDCKVRQKLEVHHVLPWSTHPHLRYSNDNSLCLCRRHHREIRGRENQFVEIFLMRILKNRWKGKT